MARKFIQIYFSFAEQLDMLSDADRGQLISALLAYAQHGENPNFGPESAVAMLFSCMRAQIDRDTEKYNEKCEKNRQNAQKAWDERGASDGMRSLATDAKEKENEKDKEKEILFEKFWNSYPKRRDKMKAKIAFGALDVDQDLLGAILKALDWQKASPDWTTDGGKYIPSAATYITNRRWEDEPPQSKSAVLKPQPHLEVVTLPDGSKEAYYR